MKADEEAARNAVIAAAQAMARSGLSPGRSGNVSQRCGNGMLITPSGMDYETLDTGDICLVDRAGNTSRDGRKPSSEWQLHAAIYEARPEADAIVHCHSPRATALACTRRDLPAFHYMVAVAGGKDIRCARYATFGTRELAAEAVAALEGRMACLLANHGQIAFGDSPAAALALAREVETLAGQYLDALAAGDVTILDDAEMAEVLARFSDYGQPAADDRRSTKT